MQYFSGRFKQKADDLLLDFHSSISFDKRLYKYDILGSIAHVECLNKANIITKEEMKKIKEGLKAILEEIEEGKITFSSEYEDIHMNIEKLLLDKIGDTAKKLHTARSRNDQVALDMKMYVKDETKNVQKLLINIIKTINNIAIENTETYMPGFTHLQKAQPVTFAHYMMAYSEMFKRDYKKLDNAYDLMNTSPLGSLALAGTTYKIDRDYTAKILGFDSPTQNSMDSVSDRDYIIDTICIFATIMMHLSRLSEEIILFSSNDFNFIELSDSFSTGSSIMPQKKNPDAAELVRGKTGRVYGNLMAILTTMKAIPLAYNKDMQEDKESFFDSLDTVKASLEVFIGMLDTMKIKKDKLLKSCYNGFINATDLADYLVSKSLSFRDAYKLSGNIVADCIEKNITLDNITIEDYKKYSDLFEKDVYEKLNIKNCVEKRDSFGGPSKKSVLNHINNTKSFIEAKEKNILEYSEKTKSIYEYLIRN